MGEVTIDSIQIEIQSNSTNAAKGLDALAGSLEKLKKNGSFKTVSNNLNHLSEALKNLPNVHSASNALRTLANSIEKLKGVGSVSSLTSSLTKLPVALKSVSGINLDRVAPQIQKVADTVAPLSNIKAGGLNTMVNSMKKLGDVTESLDDDTIARFAQKVELLNAKLAPLSDKMASIKTGFNAINTSARKASDGVEDFGDGINASALNMTSFIEIARTVIDAFTTLIQKLSEFIHQAAQWDGVKYQFGNAFGEQADEYYEKIMKITEALNINKQAFMENSAMAASMLIGFGVDKKDAREMGLGYTQLAYDIWAAYNNVYQTLDGADGAMAAVRSAIAGEVEPIRRAGFTIVEATLEQTAANHGLDISLQNATEAQKSYLRYLELVDQAHRKGVVGTYAREMQTAEGMMRTFSQQLKSLAQAFGSLFLPILVKVMPYVQAFVELLQEGVFWLASLFGIEIQDIGDTWNDFSSGTGALDGVADSAGNATGALEDATKAAKELKNATLGIDELNVISPNASADSGGSGGGSGGSGGGGGGFAGLDVDSLWDESIFDGIQQDVDRIKEKMKDWLPLIGTISTALAGLRLVKLLRDIEAIAKLSGGVAAVGGALAGIKEFFKAAKQNAPEVGWFAALFPKLSTWLAGLPAALSSATAALSAAAPYIAIVAAIAAGIALAFIEYDFTDLGYKLGEKIGSALRVGWEFIRDGVVGAFEWAMDALDIDDFWDVLAILFIPGEWFRRIQPEITELFNKVSDWINDKIENLKGNINEFFGGFFDGLFDGLGVDVSWAEKFTEFFDIEYLDIVELVVNPSSIGKHIMTGINKGIDSNTKLSALRDKLSSMWMDAKTWWDTKRSNLATYTPSIGKIWENLKASWETAKTWWSKNRGSLSTYTPSIGKIWEKLKASWENAKTWWKKNRGSLSTYTPSIGKIWEKLKSSWASAKTWWSKNRGSLSTYTPSIGSIKDKLSSAWTTAKNWWKNNVGSLSTKINVSVPTISVKWATAEAFGKSFRYPTGFSLKFAADGGIFDAGSLIWAGERGAEIVANAGGGKTGVMNVQQMQDAVYEGVYAAVTAAMRGNGGGGSQAVNVYLDGRQITSVVEQRQRERGASIMGNEVYSY